MVSERKDLPQIVIYGGYARSGKLVSNETLVLTTKGFKEAQNILKEDILIGQDGKPTKCLGVFPQKNVNMMRISFSDGSFTDCCEDHLWEIQTTRQRQKDNYSVFSTKEIIEKVKEKKENKLTIGGNRKPFKLSIRLPEPIEFERKDLPLDPYLLGNLIADGYLCGKSVTLVVGDDKEYFSALYEGQATLHSPESSVSRLYFGSIKSSKIGKTIRKLGLNVKSGDKFIPQEYFTGSIDQRRNLLAGLLDCDGSAVRNRGSATYSTVSERLAEGVCELARSLGYFSTWGKSCEKREEFRVYIRVSEGNFNPFYLARKRDKIKKSKLKRVKFIDSITKIGKGEGVCFQVDNKDKLYVIENYTVTHNTTVMNPCLKELGYEVVSTSQALHRVTTLIFSELFDVPNIAPLLQDKSKTRWELSFRIGKRWFGNPPFTKVYNFTREILIGIAERCLVKVFGRRIFAQYAADKVREAMNNGTDIAFECIGGEEFDVFMELVEPLDKEEMCFISIRRDTEEPDADYRELIPNSTHINNNGSIVDFYDLLEVVLKDNQRKREIRQNAST